MPTDSTATNTAGFSNGTSRNTTPGQPLVFYDIATRPPVEKTCCSPNPWKTRLALNFKRLPYTTRWVSLPDIPALRRRLGVPPCRKFADGTDFYTLLILEDPSPDPDSDPDPDPDAAAFGRGARLLGDSFDIAVYLQQRYPDAGAGDLFPPQPRPRLDFDLPEHGPILVPLSACAEGAEGGAFREYARFNARVDAVFSAHAQLTTVGFPFEPASEAATKAEFVRRARAAGAVGVRRWEDFAPPAGDAREAVLASLRDALAGLARLFRRDPGGPFLLGARASYADLCVGAWLRMLRVTLPPDEWERLRGWHGGVFGRLHDGLEIYAEVK